MTTRIIVDQASVAKLVKNLEVLPRRVGLKVFRIALNAWGGVVRNTSRSLARRQTGLLRKSLTVKVKIPDSSYNVKHHGRPAYVIVGPARNVVGPVASGKLLSIRKATKRVLSGGKVQTRRPSRYAHLVERRYPFIAPAARAGETSGFEKFATKIREGIAAESAGLVTT